MKTARIPHLDKDISRLVCGTDWLMMTPPQDSFAILDAYVAAGGNCFDTGHIYGANSNILGAWLQNRHHGEKFVILTKGNHPYGHPRFTYAHTMVDILESFARLGIERSDIYMFHRDDETVPVEEIVDWMNVIVKQGYISTWGGSNWRHERIAAANEYAAKTGKQGMSASSPNLTLADNVEPIWGGCLTIGDAGRDWHASTGLPIFSWSPAARGYFAGTTEADVLRAYDSGLSRERRERATELGNQKGLSATQIALAWVINQKFPTFVLSGLRKMSDLEQNLLIPDLELTADEVRWLESGS